MCLDYGNYGTHKFFVVINLHEVTKFYAKNSYMYAYTQLYNVGGQIIGLYV